MKIRHLLTTAVTCSVVATWSMAADKPAASPTPGEAPATQADKHGHSGIHPSMTAENFAMEAAMGGMMEVEMGKVAESNAANADVKSFGALMVKDHTAANQKLTAIAKAKNITLPAALEKKQQAMMEKMSALKGAAFDKAYVADMVKDHVKDVALFKKASETLTDSELKAFAAETLPILQGHLEKIKAIQASLK